FIAVTRCRLDNETKEFMERKLSEGKTKNEAIRCLKRHLARPRPLEWCKGPLRHPLSLRD
ncbi:MAG: hypothetical protein ACRDJB_12845, partial [Actinomycetota bacterium]